MRVIWSIERIQGKDWDKQFQSLLNSVANWELYRPFDTRVLYTDDYSREILGKKGILNTFAEVNKLDYSKFSSINPEVFWASGKLRVIEEQEESFIFLDNDFIIHCDILEYLDKNKLCFNFLEDGKGLYPNSTDPNIRNLNLGHRFYQGATNTSFLYFPDLIFSKEYGKLSLKIMEKLSSCSDIKGTYMIFAEQMLLYNFLKWNNIKWQCLSKDLFISSKDIWEYNKVTEGIFNWIEKDFKFQHIGISKNAS